MGNQVLAQSSPLYSASGMLNEVMRSNNPELEHGVGGYIPKVQQGQAHAQRELNTMISKAQSKRNAPKIYREMPTNNRPKAFLHDSPFGKKLPRIFEDYRFPNGHISLTQTVSPTRSQLINEAYDAFNSSTTEHLTNVRRLRNRITGETIGIAGEIVKPQIVNNKNYLSKFLNLMKKFIK